MKLTAIILLITVMHVSAKGIAQNVTLSLKNASLEHVFDQVKKQTGFSFLWDEQALKQTKPVTIDVRNATIHEVMDACLKNQGLSYSIIQNMVVIRLIATLSNQSEKDSPPINIQGRVTDSLGNPLLGATVTIKKSRVFGITDAEGRFTLNASAGDVLVITYVGFQSREYRITSAIVDGTGRQNNTAAITISLFRKDNSLGNVEVAYSTGYQSIPKERATGSFDFLDNEIINRRVSTDILSRIDGIASGVIFNKGGGTDPYGKLGINIRGTSTLEQNVNADPLIILDNYPYSGDLNNINPNDIENITILKDAAAASIWGARSGNGVIVLTTKKGKLNQKMRIEANSNVTIAQKPDIFYNRSYLDAADYIGVEKLLFNNGYFNGSLASPFQRSLSPVVEILAKQANGQLSSAKADNQINSLQLNDVRNEFLKYVYEKPIDQQYNINVSGGGDKMSYFISGGYDRNRDNLVRNGYHRTSLKSLFTFLPTPNLEITTGITYTQSNTLSNNTLEFGSLLYRVSAPLYPYAKFADAQGNPLSIVKDYRSTYIDSVEKLGFLDWHYRPIDEIKDADNTSKLNHILLNLKAKYKITDYLHVELSYQNEQQTGSARNYYSDSTYYTRNLINEFSVLNSPGNLSYNFPVGGYLRLLNSNFTSNDFRGVINFSRNIKDKHTINVIAGGEIQETISTSSQSAALGYNDQFGTAASNIDYLTRFPVNPYGFQTIPGASGNVVGTRYRSVSYYANAAYTFLNKYTFSISGREDGANVFGVRTNDRIIPLWSAGIAWDINKELFYHMDWLPHLKARLTYGYNGNIYGGSAYLTAKYIGTGLAGTPIANIQNAPNPLLKWERVKNINLGIDLASKNNILSGSIDIYQKNGIDLVENLPTPPSVGVNSFIANAAANTTRGIDLSITTTNIDRKIKWSTTLLLSFISDKVTRFDNPQPSDNGTASYLILNSMGSGLVPNVGKPLYAMYSYRWAGLDAANGDPQGYLNGHTSKDYANFLSTVAPKDLVYNGRTRPAIFGSLMNNISYRHFNLSANIVYKLGYVFRRPTTSLNYTDIVNAAPNIDYIKRWQKPGDEKTTDVPSLTYPDNYERNQFFQGSSTLIDKAGNIRLQDVRLSYDFTKSLTGKMFTHLQVYLYANNVGVLWKANKDGIDPDAIFNPYPVARSLAFGIKANF